MNVPRISARRWFWSLLLLAFLWAWIGGKTAPASNAPAGSASFMQRFQGVFGEYLVAPLLTPARFIFTKIQGLGVALFETAAANRTQNESVSDLHRRIDDLTAQIDERDRILRLLQERFNAQSILAEQGLTPADLLSATITGYDDGLGANLLTLDKGSADGVHPGMAVVAQLSLIGRVDPIVGTKTCKVRLLTDPRMKVQAILARRSNEGSVVLNNEPCLIEGMGNGQLQCDTIKVQDLLTEPARGDIVELADRSWPPKVRYMMIGQVQDVRRKETQMLRYDLSILPRVNINTIQTVLIVLKD